MAATIKKNEPNSTIVSLYIKSTNILITTNIKEINNTDPITTGKSILFRASTISLPKPFQANIYSTKTAPASRDANQPETAVITGFKEFLRACLNITKYLLNPFA